MSGWRRGRSNRNERLRGPSNRNERLRGNVLKRGALLIATSKVLKRGALLIATSDCGANEVRII